MNARHFIPAIILTMAMCLGGCQRGPGYEYATVKGAVTIDGQPVPRGAITFSPTDGGQGPVTGGDIRDGQYLLERVPVGKHTVTFIAQAAEPKEFTDATGSKRQIPRDILPPRYRKGLAVEVSAGECTRDFAMTP